MKKLIKSCLSIVLAATVVFSFTGCKKKLSATTVNTENVKVVNGVSTNGGMTVVHGDYLYFVNGTKSNDGKSAKKNTRSAICRVKYDASTGKVTDTNSYEVVVSDLVGFKNGSMYFFGDFIYYATPSSEKNKKGEILYNKTKFMRYDLVNKKSYELFTTSLNNSEETISYAYYVVGDALNLVVYETKAATITSLKIDKNVATNYVISDVKSCILSTNNGICETTGKTVDANSYVYYTVSPRVDLENGVVELPQEGTRVFRTSPTVNNSKLICNNGEDVALVTIKAGKLLTAIGDIIYVHEITGSETETLTFDSGKTVSYLTHENVVFMNEDGTISVLYFGGTGDDATSEVAIVTWKNGTEIKYEEISVLDPPEKFEMVTVTTIDEVVTEDDKDTDEDEFKTEKVQVLIYIADSIAYKLEIAREDANHNMVRSTYSDPVKLSTTKFDASTGLITPEVVGNYMFGIAVDDDTNQSYMFQVDLTGKDDSTHKATKMMIAE